MRILANSLPRYISFLPRGRLRQWSRERPLIRSLTVDPMVTRKGRGTGRGLCRVPSMKMAQRARRLAAGVSHAADGGCRRRMDRRRGRVRSSRTERLRRPGDTARAGVLRGRRGRRVVAVLRASRRRQVDRPSRRLRRLLMGAAHHRLHMLLVGRMTALAGMRLMAHLVRGRMLGGRGIRWAGGLARRHVQDGRRRLCRRRGTLARAVPHDAVPWRGRAGGLTVRLALRQLARRRGHAGWSGRAGRSVRRL